MRLIDHESHKWRYSDSSYYDFVCENCGVPEGTRKASEPCGATLKDFGSTISEETRKRLKEIDDNINRAMREAHKYFLD